MKFALILENEFSEQLNMTNTVSQYMTTEIEGLSPPDSTISTAGYVGADGSYLTNAYTEKRNLVISFAMRGVDIESRRQTLYRVVKPSKYIKVHYRSPHRNVWTFGYVESMEIENFSNETSGQISILCPDIFWHSFDSVSLSTADNAVSGRFFFSFPNAYWSENTAGIYETAMGEIAEASTSFSLTVENDGDETGLVLKLLNNGSEKAYLTQIICKNKTTGQALTISTSSSEIELNASGGYLLINTKTGEKSVQSYTKAGKAKTDYLSYVDFAASEWLTLVTGTNEITVTVTPKDESCLESLEMQIEHTNVYLGV